jgi:hypothetical protein
LYITDHKPTGFNTTKESSMTQHLSLERLILFVQMIKKPTEGHGFWIQKARDALAKGTSK